MIWLENILRRLMAEHPNGPAWYADDDSSLFAASNAIEWLPMASKPDRQKLAHFVASLMRKTDEEEWTKLYRAFRHTRLRRPDLPVLAEVTPDDAVELLGAATLNSSGYVRQAALEYLGKLAHPRAVPYVLLRLGDWVYEVRKAAQQALHCLLKTENVEMFLSHHILVDHLREIGRVDLRATHQAIITYLQELRHRGRLLDRLKRADQRERLFIFRILETKLYEDHEFAARATRDPSPVVRSWVAERLVRHDPSARDDLLRQLLRDPAPRVRLAVMRWLVPPVPPPMLETVLEQVVADSRAVRDTSRFLLRRHGNTDFAQRYRARLKEIDEDSVAPGLIAGLGETGQKDDLTLVRRFIHSPRSKVREAALRASAWLDFDTVSHNAVAALADDSGRVRRAAVTILSQHLEDHVVAGARQLVDSGSEDAQWAAFRLLASRGGWDAVPDILAGLISTSQRVRSAAWIRMDDWYRRYAVRGWLRPSDRTKEQLLKVLRAIDSEDVRPPSEYAASFRQLMEWLVEITGETWIGNIGAS